MTSADSASRDTVAPAGPGSSTFRLHRAHPGYAGDVWLRIDPDGNAEEPELVVAHASSDARHAVPLQRRTRAGTVILDARVDLAVAFARTADPAGVWRLLVRFAEGGGERVEVPIEPGSLRRISSIVTVATVAGPLDVTVEKDDAGVRLSAGARAPWAEVDRMREVDGRIRIDGHVVDASGREAGPGEAQTAECLVKRRGDEHQIVVRGTRQGRNFTFTLSGSDLPVAPRTETWDLWLRSGDHVPDLRMGSHLDDIRAKGRVFQYPWKTFAGSDEGRCQPYYTQYNNVSLRVRRGKPKKKPSSQGAATQRQQQRPPLSDTAKRRSGRVLALLEWAGSRRRRGSAPAHGRHDADEPLRVHILITGVFGMGGTIRTVLNLANYLVVHGHEVHLYSLYRSRETSFFPIDDRIKIHVLCDEQRLRDTSGKKGFKRSLAAWLHEKSSWLVHEEEARFDRFSLWTDVQLLRTLWSIRSGVVVTTRAGLNVISARFAHPAVATVGQEHLTVSSYPAGMRREIAEHFGKLDALAVLSAEDKRAYGEMLGGAPTRIERIYNALPDRPPPLSDLLSRRIIAAGRLVRMKGFDMLVQAFAQVSERHPDWELRLYGSGPWDKRIRKQIDKHGLTERFLLMGRTERMEEEMAKGSIYVLSSRFEPFGMVLTEALSCGLAVVSFDCAHGPGEIITSGVNGLLVPPHDVNALADGMCRLIEDEELRRRLATQAPESLAGYSMDDIGAQWAQLFRAIS